MSEQKSEGATVAVEPLVGRLRDAAAQAGHYGAWACGELLRQAATEIVRLTVALRLANANHERFEREWYLRGDALEAVIAKDQLLGRTPTSGGAQVWHDGPCAEIARRSLTPNCQIKPGRERSEADSA